MKDSKIYQVQLPSMQEIEGERKRLKHKKEYFRVLRSTIFALVVVAAFAVLLATLLLPVLQVSGTSMEPTLKNNDIIVLVKSEHFESGELCGFYYQNKILLKRVIGSPGDIIDIDEAGNVFVNGEELDEPYLPEKSLGECDLDFPYQVPESRYFVLGDNRATSIDSRSSVIGCIEKENLVGKVLFRVWPFNDISSLR